MNEWLLLAAWIGILAPVMLGAIGSIYGCTLAGQAAIGAMLDSNSGHARFIAISAMPASQTIYGIVVTLALNKTITPEVAPGMLAIGVLTGLAQMIGSIKQGVCCAKAIQAAKDKPEIFGLAVAPAAIVEGFSVFAFVFALILIGSLLGS